MFFMKFLQSHWLSEGSCVDLHNDLTINWLFLFYIYRSIQNFTLFRLNINY